MTKLAIFDLDGTLIHFPFAYLFDETVRILKKFGHPDVPRIDLEESFASFDYFRIVQYDLKISWDSEKHFQSKFWTEFNWKDYPRAEVFSDTLAILKGLKDAGYLMAIATARATTVEEIRSDLDHTGILPYFSVIRTRASHDDNWRDKSLQIGSILEELKVEAKNVIMIGDIPSDIESARALSLGRSYAILTGGIRKEVLKASKPTKILANLSEVRIEILNCL